MIETKTIAKGKCFGSPARQRDSLYYFYDACNPFFVLNFKKAAMWPDMARLMSPHIFFKFYERAGSYRKISFRHVVMAGFFNSIYSQLNWILH